MTALLACPECGGPLEMIHGAPTVSGSMAYETFPCRHRVGEHEATRAGVTLWVEPLNAATLVVRERLRQITDEGYTPEHDAEQARKHPGILGWMLQCLVDRATSTVDRSLLDTPTLAWPVERDRWPRGKSPLRMLIIAAALLLAEIDRRLNAGELP